MLFGAIGLIGSMILFFGAEFIANNIVENSKVQNIMIVLSPAVFVVTIAAVIKGYFNGMYNMRVSSRTQMLEQLFKSILTIGFVVAMLHIATNFSAELIAKFDISVQDTTLTKEEISAAILENKDLTELETTDSMTAEQIENITIQNNNLRVIREYKNNVTVIMATIANAASTLAATIGLTYLLIYYQKTKKEIWKNINASKENYKKEKKASIMKKILAVSIPISLASIVAAVNRCIDMATVIRVLKTFMTEDEATRLYGILSGRVDTLIGLPTALNVAFATALVPAISESMANKDTKTAKRRINFSVRTTLLIALPCAVGMYVLAEPILDLLYPNVYATEAKLLLQISAFTVIFTLLNQTIGGALQGLGKVIVPAVGLACGAVVKLILNLILVSKPEIGIYGAAISSICASLTTMFVELYVLNKHLKVEGNKVQMILKPVVAVTVMGIITIFAHKLISNYLITGSLATLFSIVIAVITYGAMILKLRVFSKDDYHMLPYGDKIYKFLKIKEKDEAMKQ